MLNILFQLLTITYLKTILNFITSRSGGGMNVIDKVTCAHKQASDNNIFLIELFKHLDDLEQTPNEIFKEHYTQVKTEYKKYIENPEAILKYPLWYIGAVGFLASFNGKFFEGGYGAWERTSEEGVGRNRYAEAKRNILRQKDTMKNIELRCCDYRDLEIQGALIYCDPPYKGVTQYATSKGFDHDQFWDWCRDKSRDNIVLISEQEAPDDFKCIWEQEIKRYVHHGTHKKITEKLFIIKGGDLQ